MLKKLSMIIVITIFILTFLANVSNAGFAPTAVELYDGKVIAYSEVSAFRLTLANGAVVASVSVKGDSQQIMTESSGNIQIVLIIDVSGSMTGTRISRAKSAAETLVENLFDLSENTKVALVPFSSDAYISVNLTNSKQDILDGINSLDASGGTNMAPAVELANQILSQGKIDYDEQYSSDETPEEEIPELHQYCVLLTDGVTQDPATCYEKLKAMDSNNVSIYGILLESDYIEAFRQNGSTIGMVYSNISNEKLLEIYNQIFDEIYNELIENIIPDFEFSNEPLNCIILENGIFITLDNELMQGALLEIEYTINIKTSMDISSVEIEDLTNGNIAFEKSSNLLTEEKINSDYGWNLIGEPILYTNDDRLVVGIYEPSGNDSNDSDENPKDDSTETPPSDRPEYIPTPPTDENDGIVLISTDNQETNSSAIIPKGEAYEKKVIYSKILSSVEDSKFEHSTMFRLNYDSEEGMAELPSIPLIITPPYGENESNISIIIFTIISIILSIVLIRFVKKILTKSKNN